MHGPSLASSRAFKPNRAGWIRHGNRACKDSGSLAVALNWDSLMLLDALKSGAYYRPPNRDKTGCCAQDLPHVRASDASRFTRR